MIGGGGRGGLFRCGLECGLGFGRGVLDYMDWAFGLFSFVELEFGYGQLPGGA